MEYIILALIVGAGSLIGLFGCLSHGWRAFWAIIIIAQAFGYGWLLSMLTTALSAWNRYGEPSPPSTLATFFAVVATFATVPVVVFRRKKRPENAGSASQTPWDE
jgi:hypothetical protein